MGEEECCSHFPLMSKGESKLWMTYVEERKALAAHARRSAEVAGGLAIIMKK